ncbi:MAG TPA: hypothetical protein VFC56_09815 [Stellaceae bacterium]|nr:hypothetical protein [Stellaceae bacterium]
MEYPERPKPKAAASQKATRASLALRIDRAAGDVNPLLIVFAIGLMILNLTLFLGMAAARQPTLWAAPHQAGPAAGTPTAPPAGDPAGYSR